MKQHRYEQVISAGSMAAMEEMRKYPTRPEYPHDYDRLYEWLEDKLGNLYEAIQLKQYPHIRTVAAEIIVTASEIVEYTDCRLKGPVKPRRIK